MKILSKRLRLIRFEHRRQAVISRGKFVVRMLRAIGLWTILTIVSLAIGIAGYAKFEGMPFVDAYVNAAMILSGMGPMGELFSRQWTLCHAIALCLAGTNKRIRPSDAARMASAALCRAKYK